MTKDFCYPIVQVLSPDRFFINYKRSHHKQISDAIQRKKEGTRSRDGSSVQTVKHVKWISYLHVDKVDSRKIKATHTERLQVTFDRMKSFVRSAF